MTHIFLDIKFNNTIDLLLNEQDGKKLMKDWCDFNNYSFIKEPDVIKFPISPGLNYSGYLSTFATLISEYLLFLSSLINFTFGSLRELKCS